MGFNTSHVQAQRCFAEKAVRLGLDPALLFTELTGDDGQVYRFIGLGRRLREHPIVLENVETGQLKRMGLQEFLERIK